MLNWTFTQMLSFNSSSFRVGPYSILFSFIVRHKLINWMRHECGIFILFLFFMWHMYNANEIKCCCWGEIERIYYGEKKRMLRKSVCRKCFFRDTLCNFLQSQPTHTVRGAKRLLYLLLLQLMLEDILQL